MSEVKTQNEDNKDNNKDNNTLTNINSSDQVVKRKKGRPRKDTSQMVDLPKQPEEKKKRGRKKKEVVVEEVKQKKKRGRKAAVKYFSSSIRKKIPLTTVLQDNNNYILHLDDVKDDENSLENNSEDVDVDVDVDANTESRKEKFDAINVVFEKLKNENIENLYEIQKEYQNLVEKEDTLLSEILNNENDLTDLYEKCIENRENQDILLFNKLEMVHKDNNNNVINMFDEFENNNNSNNEEQNQIDNRKKGYFEILQSFVENKDWLHNTDVCCWWCCHSFDTVPIGLPERYNDSIKKFKVKGIFCSFSCMIAYKKECKINCTKDYLIKFLYKKLTGTLLLDAQLEPAPPRCTLKMFGGVLSIDEFRNSFKENKIYKMIQYPMFVSKDYIEEVDIMNVKRVNQNVFTETQQISYNNLDDKRIEDAKNRLSQIEKTTVTLGNTIDKFIKIS
jgi:hypothetical protein